MFYLHFIRNQVKADFPLELINEEQTVGRGSKEAQAITRLRPQTHLSSEEGPEPGGTESVLDNLRLW